MPTHYSALLEYATGQAATVLLSQDTPAPKRGLIEISGTEATVLVPDPNKFDGPLALRRAGEKEWTPVPTEGASLGRGMGVLEMARAIRAGAPHRTDAHVALHVVEVMNALAASCEEGRFVTVDPPAGFPRPALLPLGWDPCEKTL